MHKGEIGNLFVYEDLIQIQFNKQKRIALVEFTREKHLLSAFTNQQYLYTVNNLNELEVYLITELIRNYEPTREQLEVERIRLINPMKTFQLMSAQLNDYEGVIKSRSWSELLSDFKT